MINLFGLIEMYNTYGRRDVYTDIAACLLKNFNQLDTMSTAQIAELCNVSASTLNRFYKKMSYAATVTNLPNIVCEAKEIYGLQGHYIPLTGRDLNESAIDFYLRNLQESLSTLYMGIDQKQIKGLVQDIMSCKKVVFIGCPVPQTVWMFQVDLTLYGIETSAFLDPSSQYSEIDQLQEGTIVVFTQTIFFGTNKFNEKIIQRKDKFKKLVLITNNSEHLLSSQADYSFSLPGNGVHQDLLFLNLYIQLIALTFRDEVMMKKRNYNMSGIS